MLLESFRHERSSHYLVFLCFVMFFGYFGVFCILARAVVSFYFSIFLILFDPCRGRLVACFDCTYLVPMTTQRLHDGKAFVAGGRWTPWNAEHCLVEMNESMMRVRDIPLATDMPFG